MASTALLE